MVSNRVWLVLLSVVALSLGACGGDDGGGEGGGGGTSGMGGDGDGDGDGDSNDVGPDGICERIAAILCEAEADCCDNPSGTVAACTSDYLEGCDDLEAIAADPRVGYNRPAMKSALDELQTRASACDPTVPNWALSPEGFYSSFAGTVASGGDCLPEGGADTNDTKDLGAALASCSNLETTACLPTMTDWTCAPRAAVGGTCFTLHDLNCQDGLYCDATGVDDLFSGKCAERKAGGQSCGSDNECVSLVCDSGTCAGADDDQAIYCR